MSSKKGKKISESQAVADLAALGNTTRLRLFRLLVKAGHEGLIVSDLQRLLEQPASTMAHHLVKLTQAGLVKQRREGREVICTADFTQMHALVAYLSDQCCSGVDLPIDSNAA